MALTRQHLFWWLSTHGYYYEIIDTLRPLLEKHHTGQSLAKVWQTCKDYGFFQPILDCLEAEERYGTQVTDAEKLQGLWSEVEGPLTEALKHMGSVPSCRTWNTPMSGDSSGWHRAVKGSPFTTVIEFHGRDAGRGKPPWSGFLVLTDDPGIILARSGAHDTFRTAFAALGVEMYNLSLRLIEGAG